jgi:hypothetical protein
MAPLTAAHSHFRYFIIEAVLEGKIRRAHHCPAEQLWLGTTTMCDDMLQDRAGAGRTSPYRDFGRIATKRWDLDIGINVGYFPQIGKTLHDLEPTENRIADPLRIK